MQAGTTMTLQAGAKLGTYAIDDLIGRGGMGEVYRARDLARHRFVALKVLSPDITTQGPQFARFQREARTGALLNHPNIATVYDVGSEQGVPFVVSELLHGTTLRGRLGRGPLGPQLAVRFGRQIASGLAAAHEVGVAHRDLKPENIFITAEDRVKIMDFGLARYWPEALELLQSGDGAASQTDAALARIAYLSPEQVRGEEADDRSDIFSLGAILYEMIAGAVPFRGHSTIETLNAILNDEPRPPGSGTEDIGRDLDRTIRHCLAKDPADRFQSARDLAFNLDLAEPAPRSDRMPTVPPPSSPQRGLLHAVMRLF